MQFTCLFVPPERIAAAGFRCQLQSFSGNNCAAGEKATAIAPGMDGTWLSGEGAIRAAAAVAESTDLPPPVRRGAPFWPQPFDDLVDFMFGLLRSIPAVARSVPSSPTEYGRSDC